MKVEYENWRVKVEIPVEECFRAREGRVVTTREALPNSGKVYVYCYDQDKVSLKTGEGWEESLARPTRAIIHENCDVDLLIPYAVLGDVRVSGDTLPIDKLEFNPPELREAFERDFPDMQIEIKYGGSLKVINLVAPWYGKE